MAHPSILSMCHQFLWICINLNQLELQFSTLPSTKLKLFLKRSIQEAADISEFRPNECKVTTRVMHMHTTITQTWHVHWLPYTLCKVNDKERPWFAQPYKNLENIYFVVTYLAILLEEIRFLFSLYPLLFHLLQLQSLIYFWCFDSWFQQTRI